ncbi:recombinase family protein [Micromonospora inyonensis]|uniref:Site-specific DNA recombinase n=1 Tax=Micromonospora inyonensis TaxID=47866 RepID=A0A1C6RIJ8_9ACTN|nr:recombinase family protein [Micromonospora inyonensis]SCL16998.1 Site-specific DNA recombinase [Micromonospora inyonensis]
MTPAAPRIKSLARRRAMRGGAGVMANAKRAVIYCRISLDKTGLGVSLESQETACRALCLAQGWSVARVVTDTITASDDDLPLDARPDWKTVVQTIESGEGDVIVAAHIDRVIRGNIDLEVVINLANEHGIGLATATGDIDLTTDVGRMVARILAAVARGEVERKAERQILANDRRVAEGKPQWIRRPFGYELDGTLRRDEAAAVKKGYQDVLKGKALSAVGREWNEAGFRTSAPSAETARSRKPRKREYNPTGLWNGVAVRELLRAPRNMAKSTLYGEIMGDGNWEEIVDETLWRAVNAKLADQERPDSGGGKLSNLLSGIATCSACDGTIGVDRRKNGEKVYVCKGSTRQPEVGRGHCSIGIDFADGQVVRRLIKQMEATGRVSFHPLPATVDTTDLVNREAEIARLMAELVEDRTQGLIDRAALRDGTAKLRAELADVQAELAKAGGYGPVEEVDVEAAFEEFDKLDLGEQRKILRDAFESIEVIPRGKGRRKAGEPAWRPELIRTEFTPAWS